MRNPTLLIPAIYFQRAPLRRLLRFNRINDALYVQLRRPLIVREGAER